MPKTAVEKFVEKMNETSPFWAKKVEIQAQYGKITVVKCDGFIFKEEPKK